MLRISELQLPLDADEAKLRSLAAQRLKVKPEAILTLELYRRSVDARKKNDVHFICTVDVDMGQMEASLLPQLKDPKIAKAEPYHYDLPRSKPLGHRPVVVGFGPAGMFAALILAEAGQRPIVIERGRNVDARTQDVERFWREGVLDTRSNVQFGEGGAGTFSDGKLNTGTKDSRSRKVLQEFVRFGAPPEILYLAKPHIGTDKLRETVKNLRRHIIELGGEVHFETRAEKIITKNGKITGLLAAGLHGEEGFETGHVILAPGHSARDTFEQLHAIGLPMEQKPFSVGARIEHPQSIIDRSQYGSFAGHPALGAADYKLAVHLKNNRGVYTFCMCPGGRVVAAASEEGRLVTNGMSYHTRDGKNANSALLVGVEPGDFGSSHPLAGIEFQRRLEEKAFASGGQNYRAPAQRVEDFLLNRPSRSFGEVKPSYAPGVTPSDLSRCLPEFITESMRQGILAMNQKLRGFAAPDAVLTGVESRSSSPVRILRGPDYQSMGLRGLFPCGEGAGYAGGIISAAVDGIRCAEQILLESIGE